MSERVRQYEALADWLGEQEFSRNVRDYTDEYTTVATVDVEHLADALMRSDWLAAHDREVKAEAWDEGVDWLDEGNDPDQIDMRSANPYRIESQETP